MNPDRPLDGIRSIKAKLALLVGASIVAAALVWAIGDRAGVPAWLTVPVTVVAALGVTQWLARGMTSPLREMTDAAARMATGDYSRRVTATSADEVGTLAAAFNTMATDLATADHQRRQLVATVSHELRTPLAAQQALLENLVDGVVRPDDAVLRTALAQAERLGALVGDLLDLSRVDGGRAPLDLAPVSVGDLVARAVAEARVSHRGVRHATSVEPRDLVVTADAARVHQVLANLLDNAARHSPPGSTVTVGAGADGPDRWWLEVSDEGPGIPPEAAERVFDRFGSGDDAGGGTGIGLAIASWVCELHGGSIAVEPAEPGCPGARLRAVLPRRPRAAVDPAPTSAPTFPTSPRSKEHAMAHSRPAPAGPAPTAGAVPVPDPQPFVDTVFGDLWPEAGLRPQIAVLLASLAVGLLAAAILPFRDVGLALLIVLLAGGTLVWRSSARSRSHWSVVTTVVCVGLASLVVLRAAEWVSMLAIATGVLLTTTALTDAKSLPSFAAGIAAWPLSALRGLPLLGRTISATSRVTILWPIVRTVAVSIVALVVFGGLFASGDAIFGSWAQALVPDLAWDSLVFRSFVGFVFGGSLLALCYLALNPPRVGRLALPGGRPVTHTWEWVVPVSLVVALFVAFVVAQAAALFGGHDYVQRTTGLTYAEYVHQGFGQLTVATLLTLATVAIAARRAPRDTARHRLVLRSVLGALCLLTLVVVGSALHRMDLYQQAYGFTVLRLLVDGFELWLGLLVVLVLVAGVRLSGWWLPRAAMVSAALFVLGAGVANPEAWVAQRNIDRYEATGRLDASYLHSLGPDAAPTIVAGLPRDLASCIVSAHGLPAEGDLLEWNLGRARAASLGTGALSDLEQSSCANLLRTGLPR
ncbi:histidine kinase [Intrasporangium oryzae NRRL B-24470]|uniref:Signal transduction histidine-protein kinase/phosphatase MprB n=1 Tax=Intrasporangium oryzae NRRL B-24470 TaxID=1386089 RepID=W9G8D8_9MICO|nr:DUF4153 domain-containing protein [Intrasporangium oryzae]EWT01497.1 histidine kinase [Intrasporangium oryzae NRRL B-24470]